MDSLNILLITAAGTGFVHALIGPDHYLPFIFIAKARNWSLKKTLFVTFNCGLVHLASSIIISFVGIAVGYGISQIESFDLLRGNLAAWVFLLFGFSYMIWGIHQALKNKPHKHFHSHGGNIHKHSNDSKHTHEESKSGRLLTPWVLFIIFLLGPCEILIPQVMIPAAHQNTGGVFAVIALFSIATILTMCAAVVIGYHGFKFLPTTKIERFMHAIAGGILFLSGLAMVIL